MTRVIVFFPDLEYFLYNFCINFHKLSLSKYYYKRDFRDEVMGGIFSFQSRHSGFTPRKSYWCLYLPLLITLRKRG